MTIKKLTSTLIIFIGLIMTIFLIFPHQKAAEDYTIDYLSSLKETAIIYEDSAYHLGEIPMGTLIKVSGIISKTDSKETPNIKKSDRFILELSDGKTKLHIINHSSTEFSLHDTVTVYGEYHGIIKADFVETSVD